MRHRDSRPGCERPGLQCEPARACAFSPAFLRDSWQFSPIYHTLARIHHALPSSCQFVRPEFALPLKRLTQIWYTEGDIGTAVGVANPAVKRPGRMPAGISNRPTSSALADP